MNLKKKYILHTLTGLGMMTLLSACGGDSASINEDPNKELVSYSNGCSDLDARCQNFVIDYPVSGLDFDCKLDKINHFTTKLDKNLVTGGCRRGDSVRFSIQSPAAKAQIVLGNVELAKLNPSYSQGSPTQIGLMHIAAAMTGKEMLKDDLSDDSFRVMVGLVRVFQALGAQQDANQVGDIQHLILDPNDKKGLSQLESNVDVNSFLDGSYVSKLKPWIDVSSVDEDTAQQLARQLLNLAKVNVYSANMVPFKFGLLDVGGFYGKSSSGNDAIANLYLLNMRDGHTLGYAVQWTGKPQIPAGVKDETLTRVLMINQFVPQKLNAEPQLNWVNAFSNKISRALLLQSPNAPLDQMQLNQGRFVNGNIVPGNEFVYKRSTGEKGPPSDTSVYGAWTQQWAGETYTGHLDIYKTNPATYLDRRVFKAEAKVKSGENYIFPLYANLIFDFGDEKNLAPVKLGIVIDENGDIRTNRTATELYSEQCPSMDASSYVDQLGVQQYRIGTTGSVNDQAQDKSVTLRMILSNPIFAQLDGAIIGLNETFILVAQQQNKKQETIGFNSGGVRINLQNLLVNADVSRGIAIRGWDEYGPTEAKWGNMLAAMQKVYNSNKDNATKITVEQQELAKRSGGRIEIELPRCYQIKSKR